VIGSVHEGRVSGEAIDPAALRRRWLLLALVLALLALPLTIVARGPGIVPGDVEIMLAIQARPSPALDQLASAFTAIGSVWPGEPVIAAAIVVSLLVSGVRRAAAFIAVAALAGSINVLTKRIVASPRPTTDLVQVIQIANGSGFPSGHAFSATLLYGAIWLVLPGIVPNQTACRLLRGIVVLIAVGICWSRIRLGAHWPSDVLGGILWGMVVLSLLAALFLAVPTMPQVRDRWAPHPRPR
jgi:membrane-associated phospholipid phosphatase